MRGSMLLRFIGEDGSMGLRKGGLYRISVKPWKVTGVQVTVPVNCPYSSLASFWRNWALPREDAPCPCLCHESGPPDLHMGGGTCPCK